MNKGLGRGLGALIPTTAPVINGEPGKPASQNAVLELALDKIRPNPDQPRKIFEHQAMEDLINSLKEHGILQPLVVMPPDLRGVHTIIAGERRYRAAQTLSLKKVPVVIRDVKEQQRLEMAIVENIQRADLTPLEEARSYKRLMDEFNLTQEEVATRLGKNRSSIANTLRLLELAPEVQQALQGGKISIGHAKILAGLPTAVEQENYLSQVLKQKLSVRDLDQVTQVQKQKRKNQSQSYDPVREAQEEILRDRFGTKAQIKKSGQTGQIILHFYSLEELQRLLGELS